MRWALATGDIAPTPGGSGTLTWGSPMILTLLVVAAASVVANFVMLAVVLSAK